MEKHFSCLLIHARWAVAPLGSCIERVVDGGGHGGVPQLEVGRLIVVVVGATPAGMRARVCQSTRCRHASTNSNDVDLARLRSAARTTNPLSISPIPLRCQGLWVVQIQPSERKTLLNESHNQPQEALPVQGREKVKRDLVIWLGVLDGLVP